MTGTFPSVRLVDVLDILVVAFLIYGVFLFIRGTRAVQILFGLLLVMGMYVLSRQLGMVTFQWVVGNFLGGFIIILVIIFQSEIRRALAKVGQARLLGRTVRGPGSDFLEDLSRAVFRLASSRTGAILLLERDMGLSEYVEHGKKLDALFSYELLAAILSRLSPLHDGAVVLRDERLAASGIILPIPADSALSRSLGTRHRAAWGVAAETDAVAIVVSEETGNVTVFFDRKTQPVGNVIELMETLRALFRQQ